MRQSSGLTAVRVTHPWARHRRGHRPGTRRLRHLRTIRSPIRSIHLSIRYLAWVHR